MRIFGEQKKLGREEEFLWKVSKLDINIYISHNLRTNQFMSLHILYMDGR